MQKKTKPKYTLCACAFFIFFFIFFLNLVQPIMDAAETYDIFYRGCFGWVTY